jgi:hypothetical protein
MLTKLKTKPQNRTVRSETIPGYGMAVDPYHILYVDVGRVRSNAMWSCRYIPAQKMEAV